MYEENAGWLYAVCMRYAADRDLANDMLQDAFIMIFEKLESYKGQGEFKGWMRRVTVNIALGQLRKDSRRKDNQRMQEHHENAIIDVDLMNEIDKEELTSYVQGLSDGRRQVFNAYFIEGYSHKEIAAMMGISEGTSKSQLHDAKRELRKAIEQNYAVAKKENK
ncbi:RNA polymerase sigma factor [Crocinitomix catalasitica]|nr:RNA polymerase sigma factor [Crocinitomix catalasitica]